MNSQDNKDRSRPFSIRLASSANWIKRSPRRLTHSLTRHACELVTDVDHISGENFFDVLDNGAVLCRLARVIQEKARTAVDAARAKGVSSVYIIVREPSILISAAQLADHAIQLARAKIVASPRKSLRYIVSFARIKMLL